MIKELWKQVLKSFKSGDITAGIIGLAVAVIVTVGVGIPITQQVITDSNLTGITATVVGFIPVMMAVTILLGAVSIMRGNT